MVPVQFAVTPVERRVRPRAAGVGRARRRHRRRAARRGRQGRRRGPARRCSSTSPPRGSSTRPAAASSCAPPRPAPPPASPSRSSCRRTTGGSGASSTSCSCRRVVPVHDALPDAVSLLTEPAHRHPRRPRPASRTPSTSLRAGRSPRDVRRRCCRRSGRCTHRSSGRSTARRCTAGVVPDFAERRKTAWLDADLAALGAPAARRPRRPAADHASRTSPAPATSSRAPRSAARGRRARAAATLPHRFFTSYGSRRGAMWAGFRGHLRRARRARRRPRARPSPRPAGPSRCSSGPARDRSPDLLRLRRRADPHPRRGPAARRAARRRRTDRRRRPALRQRRASCSAGPVAGAALDDLLDPAAARARAAAADRRSTAGPSTSPAHRADGLLVTEWEPVEDAARRRRRLAPPAAARAAAAAGGAATSTRCATRSPARCARSPASTG